MHHARRCHGGGLRNKHENAENAAAAAPGSLASRSTGAAPRKPARELLRSTPALQNLPARR